LNGARYDFTPLMKTNEDYIIGRALIGSGWDIILNMCTPIQEKQCGNNDAICQVWDYKCPNPKCGVASLGSINDSSFIFRNGQPVLVLKGGDEGRYSEIRFICAPGTGVGFPRFLNEDPYKEYNFIWDTEYACPVQPVNDCFFKLGDKQVNLSPMRSFNDFYIPPEYSVNICGSLMNGCISNVSDSVACQRLPNVELSLGNSKEYTYSWDQHNSLLNITFSGGDGGRMSNYLLLCSRDYENPFFLNENPTKVYNFIWRNPLICNSTFVESLLK